jgi:hypothetical protein
MAPAGPGSARLSGDTPWKTFPRSSSCPPASTTIGPAVRPAVALRANAECAIRGDAPARTTTASPGLSCRSLASSAPPDAAPNSTAACRAPAISMSTIVSRALRRDTPVPSGVAASPTIRKPDSSAPATSIATIAASASEAPPGRRIDAPRDTRLRMRTPSGTTSRSRYSPGSTITSSPGRAAAAAAAIDWPGWTTIVRAGGAPPRAVPSAGIQRSRIA